MAVEDLPLGPGGGHTRVDGGWAGSGDRGRSSVPVSVAQVLAQDGSVAGVGFLVSGGAVITCAHVVHAAGQGPGGRVELSFPHLPDAPRVRGGVVAGRWRAPEAEDIAVVQLESVPAGARELLLGAGRGAVDIGCPRSGFPSRLPRAAILVTAGPVTFCAATMRPACCCNCPRPMI
ncbi:trypsin-like peptidase domain-containing protein [Streptomyces decoyicus]